MGLARTTRHHPPSLLFVNNDRNERSDCSSRNVLMHDAPRRLSWPPSIRPSTDKRAMESPGDYRPGHPGHPGITLPHTIQQDNLDDPAYRTQVGFHLIVQHYAGLAPIPGDGISVCAACSAINLCDLQSETGYLHSQSYPALAASAMQNCRLCICLFEALHSHAGIGNPNQALVHLNPQIRACRSGCGASWTRSRGKHARWTIGLRTGPCRPRRRDWKCLLCPGRRPPERASAFVFRTASRKSGWR